MTTMTEIPTASDAKSGYGRSILLWLLAASLIAGAYLGWRISQGYPLIGAPELHGFVLETPVSVGNFSLTTHRGERISLSDFRGQIVLIYFGYTHCPDVCPATMLQLANARQSLAPKYQDKVQAIMVTVDPERDTPELLGDYLSHFDPTFLGLTGTQAEIDAATTPLGIFYEKSEVDAGVGRYFIDHTASVGVIDAQGRLRMVWPFGTSQEAITADLNYFVRER